jgi:hypothetical protein
LQHLRDDGYIPMAVPSTVGVDVRQALAQQGANAGT